MQQHACSHRDVVEHGSRCRSRQRRGGAPPARLAATCGPCSATVRPVDGGANGPSRTFDHGRRPRESDASLLGRRGCACRNRLHVLSGVHETKCVPPRRPRARAGRRRPRCPRRECARVAGRTLDMESDDPREEGARTYRVESLHARRTRVSWRRTPCRDVTAGRPATRRSARIPGVRHPRTV